MTAARHTPDEFARGVWAKVVRDGEDDLVAVGEPLEIRVDGAPHAVTMRTRAEPAAPGPEIDRRMTLCGFARQGSVNVYTGAERVRG